MGHGIRGSLTIIWILALVSPASAQMFNVTLLHTPPARILAGVDFKISGNIIGADQVSIAALVYRSPSQPDYQVRELRLVGGDRYEGVIPAKQIKTPAIEYYCYAVDFEGNRHIIFASEQQPQSVKVVTREEATGKEPVVKKAEKKQGEKAPKKNLVGQEGCQSSATTFAVLKTTLATGLPLDVTSSPAIVSVVTRKQIESSGARLLEEVLDMLPGMTVSRKVSGEYQLAVRGVQSDPGLLVLLDGHRLNDMYNGGALLEFPAEAIERVELIRGSASALYGAGALMGVINVITRRAPGVHAGAAYGYNNSVRVSGGGGRESDSFRIGGQVQFWFTQGQKKTIVSDVLTGAVGDNSKGQVSNAPGPLDDSRLQLHAQFQCGLKKLAGGELSLQAHYLFQSRGAFVGKFDSLDRGSQLDLHLITTDIAYRLPILDNLLLNVRAYFDTRMVDNAFKVISGDNSSHYQTGDGISLTDGLTEGLAYHEYTVGTEVSTNWRLIKTNNLSGGLQFEYLLLDSFDLSRDPGGVGCSADDLQIQGYMLPCGSMQGRPAGENRMDFGAFVQDHWEDLLVEGLDLLAGFRLDYSTDFGLAYNPRIALVYSPLAGLWFRTLYTMAFRAPTFRELYEDDTFDPLRGSAGNASLGPVTSHTWEFGIEGRVRTDPVQFDLQANFFMSWMKDGIVALDTGESVPRYENNESLKILGTEVEGTARFGKRNRLFVNSSWFRAEATSAGQQQGSYITDVPQMRLNLGLDLSVLSWLNAHIGVRYGSERRNNVRRPLEMLRAFQIPSYVVVRLGLTTEPVLFDHFAIFAFAYNIFDQDMRDPSPRPDRLPGLIPRAPFTFLIGLAWRP
ncbi:MAG TPA: TonB-dependent receptor [Myxococcota bacterium]|nr:TonB-dependent receptor [Myxococcota bacterium]